MDNNEISDIVDGLELNLMTQEQVVGEFRELVSKDLATAALKYTQFAQKLELMAFDNNAQVRSLAGGPDSSSRAELIEIMVGNYETASGDVKERIIDLAVEPLLKDNSFYIQLAIVKMKNPYVAADIIRKYPLFNPGADFYEQDLLNGQNLTSPGNIQKWLDKIGDDNFFAAMTIALQRQNPTDAGIIVEANKHLFEGAAHIVASHHDMLANRRIEKDSTFDRPELLKKYRSSFVDEFIEMIRQKNEEANWLSPAEF